MLCIFKDLVNARNNRGCKKFLCRGLARALRLRKYNFPYRKAQKCSNRLEWQGCDSPGTTPAGLKISDSRYFLLLAWYIENANLNSALIRGTWL